MRYTVARLHKELGKLILEGHGRKTVLVNKSSFHHKCERDGVVVLDLSGFGIQWVPTSDGDGSAKLRADGREAGGQFLVLVGDLGADTKGNLLPLEGQ